MILIWLASCFYRYGCACYLSCAGTQSSTWWKCRWCDKHDEDNDNSNEMVGSHKRLSDVEKEEVDLPKVAWIEEISP